MKKIMIVAFISGLNLGLYSGLAYGLDRGALWNSNSQRCEIGKTQDYNTGWMPCSNHVLGDGYASETPESFVSNEALPPQQLTRAHLEHSYMFLIDLQGVRAEGAHFDGTDLSDADLRGAHFSGNSGNPAASFRNANLAWSHLEGADLRGCDLRGADLSNATFDKHTRFDGAQFDTSTKLPFGWTLSDSTVESATRIHHMKYVDAAPSSEVSEKRFEKTEAMSVSSSRASVTTPDSLRTP